MTGQAIALNGNDSSSLDGSIIYYYWDFGDGTAGTGAFSNTRVKITIAPHLSTQEAKEIVRSFVKYNSEKQEIKGLGDEAYSWGYANSDIVFTRGRFIVYVSTNAEVGGDTDAQTLTQEQRGERERSERKRLSSEFAKHMVTAIDLP